MTGIGYPLLFAPVYKDYVWGGHRFAERYGRIGTPDVCAESWEITAHPDGMGRVANGPLAGETLAALACRFGARLTGTRAPQPSRFPLLVKLIDARENLSVQVHPSDDNAGLVGGEAKTEAWYVLDRTPGALLYAGLKPGTTPDSFRVAMSQGMAPQQLFRLSIEPGEALFIPGGLVHSIGNGCLLFEVQQNSNTTYRLFDWGRFDASGQPRQLHIQQAFQVIDHQLAEPRMIRPTTPVLTPNGNAWQSVLTCRHFTLRRMELRRTEELAADGTTFHALFVLDGAVEVATGGVTVPLKAGTSCLIAASAKTFTLRPAESTSLLVTTLGTP